MMDKEGCIEAILRKKIKKAILFHCANHGLNLLVNDVNEIPEVRNAVSTVKDIIIFYVVPNSTKMHGRKAQMYQTF